MNRLAELYPNSRFAGLDFSAEAIANARGEAAQKGLRNIEFTERDLTGFDRTAEPDRSISSPRSTPSTTRPGRSTCSRASIAP